MNTDPGVDLWALDEVHFQQYGSRCRLWVPPEDKDPILLHHPTRKSVAYFGAVRLRDGRFVYRRETERFNGQSFWDFLKLLRQRSRRPGQRVVVITDNARYHHAKMHKAWRDAQAPDFSLDYLPPYSPDLNPHRAGLEIDAQALSARPVFSNARQRYRGGRKGIQPHGHG